MNGQPKDSGLVYKPSSRWRKKRRNDRKTPYERDKQGSEDKTHTDPVLQFLNPFYGKRKYGAGSEELYPNPCYTNDERGTNTGSNDQPPLLPPPEVFQPFIHYESFIYELFEARTLEDQLQIFERHIVLADYDRIRIMNILLVDIENTLRRALPQFELHPFGSMVTGLALKGSDLDVVVWCNESPKRLFNIVLKCIRRANKIFSKTFGIPRARVPIVKVFHNITQVNCDIAFQGRHGPQNSKLLRHYFSSHERFRQFMLILKYWARLHDVIGQNKMTSYSFVVLGLSFLQTLEDEQGNKILPSIKQLQQNIEIRSTDDWDYDFDETPLWIRLPNSPQFSVISLVTGFFQYILCFPFESQIVSVYHGKELDMESFKDFNNLPDEYNHYKNLLAKDSSQALRVDCNMVIQDPFKLNVNISSVVNNNHFHHIINECRAAWSECSMALLVDDKRVLRKLLSVTPPTSDTVRTPRSTPTGKGKNKKKAHTPTEKSDKRVYLLEHPTTTLAPEALHKLEFETLNLIFTEILKLYTLDSTRSKDSQTLCCKGSKTLWVGRAGAKAELGIPAAANQAQEEEVSKHLLVKTLPYSPIHFSCTFTPNVPLDGNKHFVLELENLSKEKVFQESFTVLKSSFNYSVLPMFQQFVKNSASVNGQSVNWNNDQSVNSNNGQSVNSNNGQSVNSNKATEVLNVE